MPKKRTILIFDCLIGAWRWYIHKERKLVHFFCLNNCDNMETKLKFGIIVRVLVCWKTIGSRLYGQNQYLLWPIRDILERLNRNMLCKESTFVFTFDTDFLFLPFYCFLKMHKQYLFNSKVTHYSNLCRRGPTSQVVARV